MADKKISQLTAATTPLAGTEVLPIVQSSSTVKVAVSNLTAGRNVSTKNVTAGATLSPWGSGTTGVFEASGGGLNMALYAAASGLGGVTNNFYTVPGTGDFYAADGVATRYYQFNGQHVFQRAATGLKDAAVSMTTVMATDTSNNVTVSTGNLVIGTAGKGIDFSVDGQAAGMTSELLDDYEEGTWTPTLTTTGTDFTSVTLDIVRGAYTKIGNLVYVTGTIRSSAVTIGSASGFVVVGGLPFTVNATYDSALTVSYADSWASNTPRTGRFNNNNTNFYLINTPTANGDYAINAPASVATGAGSNRLDFSGYFFV